LNSILLGLTLLLVLRSLQLQFGERARCVMIPAAFAASSWHFVDYTHYASESMPNLLLAVIGFVLARTFSGLKTSAIGFGLLLGFAPLAKLSLLPLLALAFVIYCWRTRALVGTLIGILLAVSSIAVLLVATGTTDSFYHSYLARNLAWANQFPRDWQFYMTWGITNLFRGSDFAPLAWVALIATSTAMTTTAIFGTRDFKNKTRLGWMVLTLVALATSAYSAARPGTGLWHHLLIMMVPLWLLTGAALVTLLVKRSEKASLAATAVMLLAFIGLKSQANDHPTLHRLVRADPRQIEFAGQIKAHVSVKESVAFWGWNPDLRLRLGVPQSTRYATSALAVTSQGELRRYFTTQFEKDLDREQPKFLIDTTGTCDALMPERAEKSLQNADFSRVLSTYQLLEELPCGRIYQRRWRTSKENQVQK
jgi:hypothetical protein